MRCLRYIVPVGIALVAVLAPRPLQADDYVDDVYYWEPKTVVIVTEAPATDETTTSATYPLVQAADTVVRTQAQKTNIEFLPQQCDTVVQIKIHR